MVEVLFALVLFLLLDEGQARRELVGESGIAAKPRADFFKDWMPGKEDVERSLGGRPVAEWLCSDELWFERVDGVWRVGMPDGTSFSEKTMRRVFPRSELLWDVLFIPLWLVDAGLARGLDNHLLRESCAKTRREDAESPRPPREAVHFVDAERLA